jgi:hypothetical protein
MPVPRTPASASKPAPLTVAAAGWLHSPTGSLKAAGGTPYRELA